MPTINTLLEDINHFITTKEISVNDKEKERIIKETIKDIEYALRDFLSPRESDKKPHLRASNIGHNDRKLYYDMNGDSEEEKLSPQLLTTFLQGHILEAVILMFVEMSGHEVSSKQVEVELEGIIGHIDCVIDNTLIDIKTASPYSYVEKFVKGGILEGKDDFGYALQADLYAQALGLEERGWLAMNNASGAMTLLINDSFINNAKEQVKEKKELIAKKELPPRCYNDKEDGKGGNKILEKGCQWCRHKFHCWENLRGFKYSNGVKWFTHVEKEPKVEEI